MEQEIMYFRENAKGQELLHTPGGVRDIYGMECARKLKVEKEVHDVDRKSTRLNSSHIH